MTLWEVKWQKYANGDTFHETARKEAESAEAAVFHVVAEFVKDGDNVEFVSVEKVREQHEYQKIQEVGLGITLVFGEHFSAKQRAEIAETVRKLCERF